MTAPDPVQAVAEALYATAREHRPTTGMQVASGATCECGYWTGSEAQGPIPSGWHMLLPHMLREAAEAAVAAARPAIAAEAKAAALRDAAEAVLPAPHPNRCLAFSCVECARRYERDRLRDWLRDRADRIEADDDRT